MFAVTVCAANGTLPSLGDLTCAIGSADRVDGRLSHRPGTVDSPQGSCPRGHARGPMRDIAGTGLPT